MDDIINYINSINTNNINIYSLENEINDVFNNLLDNESCSIEYTRNNSYSLNGIKSSTDLVNYVINYSYTIPNLFRKCYTNKQIYSNNFNITKSCPIYINENFITYNFPLILDQNLIKSFFYYNISSNYLKYNVSNIETYIRSNILIDKLKNILKSKRTTNYGFYTQSNVIFNELYSTDSLLVQFIDFFNSMQKANYAYNYNLIVNSYNIPWNYTAYCICYNCSGNNVSNINIIENNVKILDQSQLNIIFNILYGKDTFNIPPTVVYDNGIVLTVGYDNIFTIIKCAQQVYEDVLLQIESFLLNKDYCLQPYMNISNIPILAQLYKNYASNEEYINSRSQFNPNIVIYDKIISLQQYMYDYYKKTYKCYIEYNTPYSFAPNYNYNSIIYTPVPPGLTVSNSFELEYKPLIIYFQMSLTEGIELYYQNKVFNSNSTETNLNPYYNYIIELTLTTKNLSYVPTNYVYIYDVNDLNNYIGGRVLSYNRINNIIIVRITQYSDGTYYLNGTFLINTIYNIDLDYYTLFNERYAISTDYIKLNPQDGEDITFDYLSVSVDGITYSSNVYVIITDFYSIENNINTEYSGKINSFIGKVIENDTYNGIITIGSISNINGNFNLYSKYFIYQYQLLSPYLSNMIYLTIKKPYTSKQYMTMLYPFPANKYSNADTFANNYLYGTIFTYNISTININGISSTDNNIDLLFTAKGLYDLNSGSYSYNINKTFSISNTYLDTSFINNNDNDGIISLPGYIYQIYDNDQNFISYFYFSLTDQSNTSATYGYDNGTVTLFPNDIFNNPNYKIFDSNPIVKVSNITTTIDSTNTSVSYQFPPNDPSNPNQPGAYPYYKKIGLLSNDDYYYFNIATIGMTYSINTLINNVDTILKNDLTYTNNDTFKLTTEPIIDNNNLNDPTKTQNNNYLKFLQNNIIIYTYAQTISTNNAKFTLSLIYDRILVTSLNNELIDENNPITIIEGISTTDLTFSYYDSVPEYSSGNSTGTLEIDKNSYIYITNLNSITLIDSVALLTKTDNITSLEFITYGLNINALPGIVNDTPPQSTVNATTIHTTIKNNLTNIIVEDIYETINSTSIITFDGGGYNSKVDTPSMVTTINLKNKKIINTPSTVLNLNITKNSITYQLAYDDFYQYIPINPTIFNDVDNIQKVNCTNYTFAVTYDAEENTSDLINNITTNESIITTYIYNYKFTYDGINHNRTENIQTNLTTKYNYDTETYNNSNTTEIIVEDNYIENTTNINSSNIQEANNFSSVNQNPFTLGIHTQLYNKTIYNNLNNEQINTINSNKIYDIIDTTPYVPNPTTLNKTTTVNNINLSNLNPNSSAITNYDILTTVSDPDQNITEINPYPNTIYRQVISTENNNNKIILNINNVTLDSSYYNTEINPSACNNTLPNEQSMYSDYITLNLSINTNNNITQTVTSVTNPGTQITTTTTKINEIIIKDIKNYNNTSTVIL